jgi:hypothetical protein
VKTHNKHGGRADSSSFLAGYNHYNEATPSHTNIIRDQNERPLTIIVMRNQFPWNEVLFFLTSPISALCLIVSFILLGNVPFQARALDFYLLNSIHTDTENYPTYFPVGRGFRHRTVKLATHKK